MFRLKTYLQFFSLIMVLSLNVACSLNITSPTSNDFLIKVDSISLPDTVRAEKSFEISFFGTVGLNSCNSFKTFNIVTYGNEIDIQVWGTFDTHSTFCPDALVTLNDTKLDMTIPTPGMYKIVIIEPNNFLLTRSIAILPTH